MATIAELCRNLVRVVLPRRQLLPVSYADLYHAAHAEERAYAGFLAGGSTGPWPAVGDLAGGLPAVGVGPSRPGRRLAEEWIRVCPAARRPGRG